MISVKVGASGLGECWWHGINDLKAAAPKLQRWRALEAPLHAGRPLETLLGGPLDFIERSSSADEPMLSEFLLIRILPSRGYRRLDGRPPSTFDCLFEILLTLDGQILPQRGNV